MFFLSVPLVFKAFPYSFLPLKLENSLNKFWAPQMKSFGMHGLGFIFKYDYLKVDTIPTL